MKGKLGDVLKTAGAVLIIGGIIVATFLYGNKQRVEQQRRDQQVRQEQEEQAKQQTASQQPAPSPQQQPTANNPQPTVAGNVGGSTGQIPAAGADLGALVGTGAIAAAGTAVRLSRRNLRRALSA